MIHSVPPSRPATPPSVATFWPPTARLCSSMKRTTEKQLFFARRERFTDARRHNPKKRSSSTPSETLQGATFTWRGGRKSSLIPSSKTPAAAGADHEAQAQRRCTGKRLLQCYLCFVVFLISRFPTDIRRSMPFFFLTL